MRILLVYLSLAWMCRAQSPTGGIEGLVVSEDDSPITGVRVTIERPETGNLVQVETNSAGLFRVGALLPGRYEVRFDAAGYRPAEILDVELDGGELYDASVTLQRGSPHFSVTVYAPPTHVQVNSHSVRTVINAEEIRAFPLRGRNFLDLAELAPGVRVRPGATLDPTKASTAYRAVGISGRVGAGTRILFEGLDFTDPVAGGTLLNVSPESVREFQVVQSGLSASTWSTSSGAVETVGLTGSNVIHGSFTGTYFNERMSARQNYLPTVQSFNRKQTAGGIGGPVARDKLFWFASHDQTWQDSLVSSEVVNFPQLTSRDSFESSIGLSKMRLDWNVSGSTRVFAAFLHENSNLETGNLRSPQRNSNWATSYVAGMDRSGARETIALRFGYLNFNNRITSVERAIPFPRTPGGIPFFLSVGAFAAGPAVATPQETGTSSFQNTARFDLFRGRQSIQIGGSLNRLVVAGRVRDRELSVFGTYNPSTIQFVQQRGGDVTDPFEYPLAGAVFSLQQGYATLSPGHGFRYGAHHDLRTGLFASHSLHLRRFKITSAIRWDYGTGYFHRDDGLGRERELERWLSGGSAPLSPPKRLLSPRIGIAYSPFSSGTTTIRASFSQNYEWLPVYAAALDRVSQMPARFGTVLELALLTDPDGRPINIDGQHVTGMYNDLRNRPIREVIGVIESLHEALHRRYSAFTPTGQEESAFRANRSGGPFFPGRQFKPPYALQFNAGVEQRLSSEVVLSVDYIRHRGVGLPLLGENLERTRWSDYFDDPAARRQVDAVLRGNTVDQWIAANPGRGIAAFGLVNDVIWPGVTPDYQAVVFRSGGYSLYRALNFSLRARASGWKQLRDVNALVNYTLSRSEATDASANPEVGLFTANRRNQNSREFFTSTTLDSTHQFSGFVSVQVPLGFRITTHSVFRTPPTASLSIPLLSAGGSNDAPFTTDIDGDSRTDFIAGLNRGQFGRGIDSLRDLNRLLAEHNRNVAGQLTAHGRRLVQAGLFTEEQMRRLGAVIPAIPLVPETNPYPFRNLFTSDVRVERPLSWNDGRVRASPFLDVWNIFNYAPPAPYSGLTGVFGSLNFDYQNAPAGRQISDLRRQNGRLNPTRQVQVGFRVEF